MQANKPYISTGVRHIFAIISSQISTMMEPVNAILKHEPANRRLEISPRDISFLSSLSIIHGHSLLFNSWIIKHDPKQMTLSFSFDIIIWYTFF